MLWAAFKYHGVDPIVNIDTKLDEHLYLRNHMISFENTNFYVKWVFFTKQLISIQSRIYTTTLRNKWGVKKPKNL